MKRRQKYRSKIFHDEKRMTHNRELFYEGDWVSIQEHLRLAGWDYLQRELIHNKLKIGVPLTMAVSQTANNIGRCPLSSKKLIEGVNNGY